MIEYKPIKELNIGDEIGQTFLIADAEARLTKKGKPFTKLVLKDATGQINVNIWDFDLKENRDLQPGAFIVATIKVGEYQGMKNASSNAVPMLVAAPSDLSPYELTLGLTPQEIEEHWSYISDTVDTVEDIYLKEYLRVIISVYAEGIKNGAASASNRGAFRGGLVEHYAKVMRNALACMETQLLSKLQPSINRDIIIAGVIAHDLGKIFTYKIDSLGVTTTRCGHLIQHLPLSYSMSVQAWIAVESSIRQEVPEELKDHINHIILSHHGKLEYGSPVVPKSIEAYIVHTADMMDSMTSNYAEDSIADEPNLDGFVPGGFFSTKNIYVGSKHEN